MHPFVQSVVPHFECVNDVYVYPKHLVIKSPSPHSNIQVSVQIIPESSLRAGAAVGRTKYVYPSLYTWGGGANGSSDAPDTPPALLGEGFSTIQADENHPEFGDEFKLQLPSSLSDLCLLFTVYNVSYSGGKFTRSAIGHAGLSLAEQGSGGGAVRRADDYYLPVVKVLGELVQKGMNPVPKAVAKKSKSFLHIRLVPWSSLFPEDSCLANFLEAASVPEVGSPEHTKHLQTAMLGMSSVEPATGMRFLLPVLRAFFRIIACCDLGPALVAYKHVGAFLSTVFQVPDFQNKESDNPLLRLYANVFFDPILFGNSNNCLVRPLHEGLVRAWTDLLKVHRSTVQERSPDSPFTWFFLELITKSIEAYVCAGNTLSEDFQWNVLGLIADLLALYKTINSLYKMVSLRALGVFIDGLFPLISGRGKLINVVMGYLTAADLDNKDPVTFNMLKLPLVQALADYEHFVPINRPLSFEPSRFENVATLNASFTALHPFVGEIIHEVCTSILAPNNRIIAIKTFRDLLRKHSADDRYRDPQLQADIALMYFPAVLNLMELRPEIEALHPPQQQQQQQQQATQSQSQQQTTQAQVAQLQQQQQQFELLTAYMWIVKTCPPEAFRAWWRHDTEKRHIMFFDMLCFCLECFRGQDQLDSAIAAVARICTDFSEDNTAALAAPGNPVFRCIYECLTTALSLARDGSVKVTVDAIRALLARVPEQFFTHRGNSYIDGVCTEIFRAVGESRYNGVMVRPMEAADFLFSMFEQNYARTGDTLRMRTQAVLAISRLFVESSGCTSRNNGSKKAKCMKNARGSISSESGGASSSGVSSGASSNSGSSASSVSRKNSVCGGGSTTATASAAAATTTDGGGFDEEDVGTIDFDTLLSIVHSVQDKCVAGETAEAVSEGISEVVFSRSH